MHFMKTFRATGTYAHRCESEGARMFQNGPANASLPDGGLWAWWTCIVVAHAYHCLVKVIASQKLPWDNGETSAQSRHLRNGWGNVPKVLARISSMSNNEKAMKRSVESVLKSIAPRLSHQENFTRHVARPSWPDRANPKYFFERTGFSSVTSACGAGRTRARVLRGLVLTPPCLKFTLASSIADLTRK